MSCSYRKTKIFGHAGSSEKEDKRINNRMFRRREKQAIEAGKQAPVNMNEVRNLWDMNKDGKFYWEDAPDKYMRK